MRIQFSIASLLLVTVCVAIVVGGPLASLRIIAVTDRIATSPDEIAEGLARLLLVLSSWWMPMVYIAYSVGRRKLTPRATIGFALLEAASLAALYMYRIA
jgi:hypothetical protein